MDPSGYSGHQNRIVAVVDLGKTNWKVALVDTTVAEEIELIRQTATTNTDTDYLCLDHQTIEAFIVSSLSKLNRIEEIDAITVSTHGATAALIDRAGALTTPVIDYEFSGIDSIRDAYEQVRPPFAETGSPSLPSGLNVGAQLYWLQTIFPQRIAKTTTVLTWPQYWVFRLTGSRNNDLTSLGAHTDLFNPYLLQYSSLVHSQQWTKILPEARRSGEFAGYLDPTIANKAGLRRQVGVFNGIHDSNASLVPHLLSQTAPFTVLSTGTWIVALASGGRTQGLNPSRDTLININIHGECVPCAKFMGGRERDLLGITEPVADTTMNEFLAGDDKPTLLMPSVVTSTGPYPEKKHRWIERGDSPVDRACAATLYLSLMSQETMDLVGARGPTFVEGPLSQDEQYLQMLAASTNRPVMVGKTKTGTSVGAAMLINQSGKPIEYTQISVDNSKREKLIQYGDQWKEELDQHV